MHGAAVQPCAQSDGLRLTTAASVPAQVECLHRLAFPRSGDSTADVLGDAPTVDTHSQHLIMAALPKKIAFGLELP